MTHHIQYERLLPSAPGTSRTVGIHRFGVPGALPKIYLQGALHADELPGAYILHHLIERLRKADRAGAIKGEIVVVPLANPIGLAQRIQAIHAGRSDLGLGGNFNRNYADLSAPLHEHLGRFAPEAISEETVRAFLRLEVEAITQKTELDSLKKTLLALAIDADYVFDLHCDDEAPVYVYLSDENHPQAVSLTRDLGARAAIAGTSEMATFKDACARPWQIASRIAGRPLHGCLAATIEYRGTRDVNEETAQSDAKRLYAFMQRVKILDGEPEPLPPAFSPITPLAGVEHLQADRPGIIVFRRQPGEQIAAGETVAEIVDPVSGDRSLIKTFAGGVFFGHVATRLAVPGSTIASLAGIAPRMQTGEEAYP
ncbi:succinylglutamate desuccinylase/aspartoacylase family protein [Shinella sp.]|uniref:succinylglutamate desuccinylase/aspartoacylase domain-containing protein n=1 Tax=Shinella sp. TaxID=1870904 RepID=UPI0029A6E990|nr:succinylglutamate desuccinylase/aspartoacylase family protein [Shinella sp.]MDX3978588.1 succinylglutamate desuccinylase/aspartoacylase family protein [Shinella sp.]